MFDLTTNYFDLFGVERSYQLDLAALKTKYIELQRQVHPDNYAADSDSIQRQAMQRVSYLNQAHESLKSPLQRAIYMLELAKHDFDVETQVHTDPVFLMQQMELREELAEANEASIDQLRARAVASYREYQNNFALLIGQNNYSGAAEEVGKMMFSSKLLNEISEKEERLFD